MYSSRVKCEVLAWMLEFSYGFYVFVSIQQMKQNKTNRTFDRGELKLQGAGLSIAWISCKALANYLR